MDSLIPEGIRQLAGQGTGWLLFCFASGLAFWLLLQLLKSKQTCQDLVTACTEAREVLQEKRIEEARQTVAALNTAAATLAELVVSMKERTASVDTLVNLSKQTARDIEANSARWQDRVGGIERSLERIEELARHT